MSIAFISISVFRQHCKLNEKKDRKLKKKKLVAVVEWERPREMGWEVGELGKRES